MNTSTANKSAIPLSPTPLGDVRAELDHAMLSKGFLETPDYKTLLETQEGKVVVGRRGTGKSALMYQLSKHWRADKSVILISISPDEDHMIGLRPLLEAFGEKFHLLRAGSRLIWRYALTLDILDRLATRYKTSAAIAASELLSVHIKRWRASGTHIFSRVRNTVGPVLSRGLRPEDLIGDLALKLNLRDLERELQPLLEANHLRCVILIDRLDEGFQTDTPGVAFVDGVILGATEVESAGHKQIKSVVFLRDNIYRAVAALDPDFSRNIEGQTLRLHWDTYQLFNFVCNRLRTSFFPDIENNQRLWDRCTVNELQQQTGFRRCLQFTLYRPRDLLILLNQAFYNAARQSRREIVFADINASATNISNNRLGDLHKEYEAILPGLTRLTSAFHGGNPELPVGQAEELLIPLVTRDDFSPDIQQDFAVFRQPSDHLRNLYSVGFLGIHDKDTTTFVFCHDGKQPDKEFKLDDRVLVHPCYWLALNLSRTALTADEATEINDEYDIEVTSQTPEIRQRRIGQIISALAKIPLGREGDSQFEEWCEQVVRIVFAGKLRNVQLHANRNATQRRDVIATNLSARGAWKRIADDYKARQVIFEVKNYAGIGLDEYRQMLSYLTDNYGRLGFIVTRDESHNLERGKNLDHFLEMYHKHERRMIIKLTGKYLCTMLSKVRNPQKHDEPDNLLNKLLDTYERQYLSGVPDARHGRSARAPA